jgi:hypothetical protein
MWKGKLDRSARIEGEARDERFNVYRRVVAWLLAEPGTKESSKKSLSVDLVLFGSDEAVRAWIAFMDSVFDGGVKSNTPQAEELWKRMLLAMRRDASRPGTDLAGDEVMAAFGIRAGRDPVVARRRAEAAGLLKPEWEPESSPGSKP